MSEKTLLLVDDDPDDIMLLQEAIHFINKDFTFVEADNGLKALDYLKKEKEHDRLPCLIILDINMPVLDGREVLAVLKNDLALKNIPVVVFSTSSNAADLAYCKNFGVDLISKPFDMQELSKRAEELLTYCK